MIIKNEVFTMQYRAFGSKYVIRLDRGDEIISCLKVFAKEEDIAFGTLSGIGAADRVLASTLDIQKKEYIHNEFKGDFEIVSLCGSINKMNGEPYVHLHIAIAGADGRMHGGHLIEAMISGTGELVLDTSSDCKVGRVKDPESGLNIFDFD